MRIRITLIRVIIFVTTFICMQCENIYTCRYIDIDMDMDIDTDIYVCVHKYIHIYM